MILWNGLRKTGKQVYTQDPNILYLAEKEFVHNKAASSTMIPDGWSVDLESLRTQMYSTVIERKSDMTKTNLIIHILSNLTDKYEWAITDLERLEIENVMPSFNSRYKGLDKQHDSKEDLSMQHLWFFKSHIKLNVASAGTGNMCAWVVILNSYKNTTSTKKKANKK